MSEVVLRNLTDHEKVIRLAHQIMGRDYPFDDIRLTLARALLSERDKFTGMPMALAPRDGTHIIAFLYSEPDDCGYAGFGEWREIWWKDYTSLGMFLPWHAGDPVDSHSGGEAPEHFGEKVPIAWVPLPKNPRAGR